MADTKHEFGWLEAKQSGGNADDPEFGKTDDPSSHALPGTAR